MASPSRRLTDRLRQALASGAIAPESDLPSTRELAARYGVHRHTVARALAALVAEGWLSVVPRRGFRALAKIEKVVEPPRAAFRIVRHAGLPELPQADITMLSRSPDLTAFPMAALRAAYRRTLSRRPEQALALAEGAGHPRLLDWLERWLRHRRAVQGRSLMVAQGTQEALSLLSQLLIAPGDAVAMEDPGYAPAREVFRAAGAEIVPVPVDDHGLDVDALARTLRRRRIRVLYTTPLHQCPTTRVLPIGRRAQLLRATALHGVAIIEDDYDHEQRYRGDPMAALASMAGAAHVVYVGTLSKVLFPSVRVAVVAGAEQIITPLVALRRVTSRGGDAIAQAALANFLSDAAFETYLRRTRRICRERLTILMRALDEARARGVEVECVEPDGGLAIWARLGTKRMRDSAALARGALARGVLALPEQVFRADPKHPSRYLRIGFAALSGAELRRAVHTLADVALGIP